MLRIHLFSIFTIETPRALAVVAPLGLLIVMIYIKNIHTMHTFSPW